MFDPITLLNKHLSIKYSKHTETKQLTVINSILSDRMSRTQIMFMDLISYIETTQNIKHYYRSNESKKRINLCKQYYFYEKLSPTFYQHGLIDIYEKWKDRKKQYLIKKLNQFEQNNTQKDSSCNGLMLNKDKLSKVLYDISEYNPQSDQYYLKNHQVQQSKDMQIQYFQQQISNLLRNFSNVQQFQEIMTPKYQQNFKHTPLNKLQNYKSNNNQIKINNININYTKPINLPLTPNYNITQNKLKSKNDYTQQKLPQKRKSSFLIKSKCKLKKLNLPKNQGQENKLKVVNISKPYEILIKQEQYLNNVIPYNKKKDDIIVNMTKFRKSVSEIDNRSKKIENKYYGIHRKDQSKSKQKLQSIHDNGNRPKKLEISSPYCIVPRNQILIIDDHKIQSNSNKKLKNFKQRSLQKIKESNRFKKLFTENSQKKLQKYTHNSNHNSLERDMKMKTYQKTIRNKRCSFVLMKNQKQKKMLKL